MTTSDSKGSGLDGERGLREGPTVRAVLFDFGGVITTSPFDAFARYEKDNELPSGLIRRVNATNPDDNAWARFERREVDVDGFVRRFEQETEELGHRVDGRDVLRLIAGTVRPQMVDAVDRIKQSGLITACLTNNFTPIDPSATDAADPATAEAAAVMARFDHLIQSSVIGIRKPEQGFYQIALDRVGVAADEAAFLDDLGVNLKPARAMGMRTIKVVDPDSALAELETILGLSLRH